MLALARYADASRAFGRTARVSAADAMVLAIGAYATLGGASDQRLVTVHVLAALRVRGSLLGHRFASSVCQRFRLLEFGLIGNASGQRLRLNEPKEAILLAACSTTRADRLCNRHVALASSLSGTSIFDDEVR